MTNHINIYFICPNNRFVTGGVKQILRQVAFLRKEGYSASILIKNKKIRNSWFSYNVDIKYNPYIFKFLKFQKINKQLTFIQKLKLAFLKKMSHTISENDILVFPEIYGPSFQNAYPSNNFVIFNQNCYYTFNQYCELTNLSDIPYYSTRFLGNIVASEDGKKYLDYVFPKHRTEKMTLGIDADIFNYHIQKKKQICYMPRKLSEDVNQVVSILKLKGLPSDWKLIAIDNKTEIEVSNIMKDSLIFLSFNHREGFGLPPVEAMACGCHVIGYEGQAGTEYFIPTHSQKIMEGNIIDFVDTIINTISLADKDLNTFIKNGKLVSDYVLQKYSILKEQRETQFIWNNFYNKHKELRGIK